MTFRPDNVSTRLPLLNAHGNDKEICNKIGCCEEVGIVQKLLSEDCGEKGSC